MSKNIVQAVAASFITGLLNSSIYIYWIANGSPEISFVVLMSLVGASIVLGFIIFWGLPIHFLLKHYHKEALGWYFLIGALPAILIPIDSMFGAYYANLLGHTLFMAYVGVSASLVFIYSVRRNNA